MLKISSHPEITFHQQNWGQNFLTFTKDCEQKICIFQFQIEFDQMFWCLWMKLKLPLKQLREITVLFWVEKVKSLPGLTWSHTLNPRLRNRPRRSPPWQDFRPSTNRTANISITSTQRGVRSWDRRAAWPGRNSNMSNRIFSLIHVRLSFKLCHAEKTS